MKKQLNEIKRMQQLAGLLNEAFIDDEGNLQDFNSEDDLIVKFTTGYYKNEKLFDYFYCEKGLADGFEIKDNKKIKYIVGYSNFTNIPDDKKWIFNLSDPKSELGKQGMGMLLDPDNCFDADMEVIGYIYSKSGKDIETEYTEDELDDAFYEALHQ